MRKGRSILNFENYKYFTGKDLMKECNLSEKMFKNSMDKLERVYKLDITKYKSNPSATNSGYSFNLFELELFKILLNTIEDFPVPTSAKKFDDIDLREEALKKIIVTLLDILLISLIQLTILKTMH